MKVANEWVLGRLTLLHLSLAITITEWESGIEFCQMRLSKFFGKVHGFFHILFNYRHCRMVDHLKINAEKSFWWPSNIVFETCEVLFYVLWKKNLWSTDTSLSISFQLILYCKMAIIKKNMEESMNLAKEFGKSHLTKFDPTFPLCNCM